MNVSKQKLSALTIGAIGVVFGDIGTSPLYALKESFKPEHGIPLNEANVLGILSLMFWSLMTLVTVKYLTFMLRADNKGEGGILALTALAQRCFAFSSRARWWVGALGIFGAAMFFGDAVITPAISILGAVEGLKEVSPTLEQFIVPIVVGIVIALFAIQRYGTATIAKLFGPTMVLWFIVIFALGVVQVFKNPVVLAAANPFYSIQFLFEYKFLAFVLLGSVVLCVTGAEALYADMGHFGKKPIRYAWFIMVWPALLINYFGQGAIVLADANAVANPFYKMVPTWGLIPMIALATAAAIIASQATISGAFSMTKQAIQLGYLPRFSITHTSAQEAGQIYVPFTNWLMMIAVVGLVVAFKNSDNLASAYGIAVTMTMLMATLLLFVVMTRIWKWSKWLVMPLTLILVGNDIMFLSACLLKFIDGGWFPLVMGVIMFTIMSTWWRGRQIVRKVTNENAMPLKLFVDSISMSPPHKVAGTGIFMTTNSDGVPNAMLHNLKHNKVLHERVVILSIVNEDIPYVPKEDYVWIEDMGHGFWKVTGHYGFKEQPDIPKMLADCKLQSMSFEMMETTFFINRETLIATPGGGMALWREHLFVWMSHLAGKASDYFRIPSNRVVELGTQVEI